MLPCHAGGPPHRTEGRRSSLAWGYLIFTPTLGCTMYRGVYHQMLFVFFWFATALVIQIQTLNQHVVWWLPDRRRRPRYETLPHCESADLYLRCWVARNCELKAERIYQKVSPRIFHHYHSQGTGSGPARFPHTIFKIIAQSLFTHVCETMEVVDLICVPMSV